MTNANLPFHLSTFEDLASWAKPLDDSEWGSARQLDAENTFFGMARECFPDLFDDESDFSLWALKATTEELLDEAMRLIRKRLA